MYTKQAAQATACEARIRAATLEDLDSLLALEAAAFPGDRLSRRQLRHLLTRGNAELRLAELGGEVVGSLVLLFRRGTSVARVYSIAVDAEVRGRGIGRLLLEEAEEAAWRRETPWLRAEVRKDNAPSLALFEKMGYRRFDQLEDYYEDHEAAWRLEKTLDTDLRPTLARVPWYRQTLDFTCGPASLMMALSAIDPAYRPSQIEELRIWREATTIFMTSGHGGCGAHGLALAADRRGFSARIVASDPGVHLVDTVRSKDKRRVMALVQQDLQEQIAARGIPVALHELTLEEIETAFRAGEIPLILISSWQIYEERAPHWVVVTGFDEHFVYVNDPWLNVDEGETPSDSIAMPIGRALFAQIARFGRKGLRTAVFIGAGDRPDTTGEAP